MESSDFRGQTKSFRAGELSLVERGAAVAKTPEGKESLSAVSTDDLQDSLPAHFTDDKEERVPTTIGIGLPMQKPWRLNTPRRALTPLKPVTPRMDVVAADGSAPGSTNAVRLNDLPPARYTQVSELQAVSAGHVPFAVSASNRKPQLQLKS